jgi:hypothetical protein
VKTGQLALALAGHRKDDKMSKPKLNAIWHNFSPDL